MPPDPTPSSSAVSASAVHITSCGDADIPAVQRFIHQEWRADHILSRDRDLLRWQCDPSLDWYRQFTGPTILLAWRGHRLVGMLGMTCYRFNLYGEVIPAVWISHWMTVPSVRGSSLALALLQRVRALGYEVMGGLGVRPGAARLLDVLGFDVLEDLPRWVGVIDPVGCRSLVGDGMANIDWPTLALNSDQAPDPRHRVVSWDDPLGDAWDRAWCTRFAPTVVGAVRDHRYIHWRYLRHPVFVYHLLLVLDDRGSEALGLAVLRAEQVRNRAERIVRIVEFLAAPEAQVTLAQAVTREAESMGAALVDFYCGARAWASGLEGVGFRLCDPQVFSWPSRFQPLEHDHFTMRVAIRLPRAVRGRLRELADAGVLYLSKADGDQDRPS